MANREESNGDYHHWGDSVERLKSAACSRRVDGGVVGTLETSEGMERFGK